MARAKELADQHKIDHPEWKFTRNTKKRKLEALKESQAQEAANEASIPDLVQYSNTLPKGGPPIATHVPSKSPKKFSKAGVKSEGRSRVSALLLAAASTGTGTDSDSDSSSNDPCKTERGDESPSDDFVPSPATTPRLIHYGQRPLIGEVPWPLVLNGGLSSSQVQKFDQLAQMQLQAMIRQQELRHQSPGGDSASLAPPRYVPPPSIDNAPCYVPPPSIDSSS